MDKEGIATRLRNSRTLAPHLRRFRSRSLARSGQLTEYRAMYELARKGTIAIDVGANVGQCSALLAKAVGAKGIVWAFEPVPETFQLLCKATRGMNVVAVPCGVGDQLSQARIGVPIDVDHERQWQLARMLDGSPEISTESFSASVLTLDSFEDFFTQPVSLIKVDIEGYELKALIGASRVLRTHRPALVIEVEERHHDTYESFNQVFSHLVDLGYEIKGISDSGYVPFDRFDVTKHQRDPLREGDMRNYVNNFVCLPQPS